MSFVAGRERLANDTRQLICVWIGHHVGSIGFELLPFSGVPCRSLQVGGFGAFGGALSVVCAHSATIWVSGRTRDPYFVILGASLLFESRFGCFIHIGDMAFLDFHPVSPISFFILSCSFPPHPLFCRLISPHRFFVQCVPYFCAGWVMTRGGGGGSAELHSMGLLLQLPSQCSTPCSCIGQHGWIQNTRDYVVV